MQGLVNKKGGRVSCLEVDSKYFDDSLSSDEKQKKPNHFFSDSAFKRTYQYTTLLTASSLLLKNHQMLVYRNILRSSTSMH